MTEERRLVRIFAVLIVFMASLILVSVSGVVIKKNVSTKAREGVKELQKMKILESDNLKEANEYLKKIERRICQDI